MYSEAIDMSVDFKELDDLLKGLVEGTLSDFEQKRFEEMLKNDSSARQRYLDYIAVETMLSAHKVKIEHSEPVSQKRKLKISTGKNAIIKKRVAKQHRRTNGVFILAASIFLTLGLGYYLKVHQKFGEEITVSKIPENLPLSIGTIEKISGQAHISLDGKSEQAVTGMLLKSGVEIASLGKAELNIRCRDGSLLQLSPGSKLIYSKVDGQYKLNLQKGFLNASVNKQEKGKPLLISTPAAGITVLGTILRIGLIDKSTVLTVDEGRVELKNDRSQTVIVNTGESVIARPGKALKVRNIKEFSVGNLEIISAVYGAQDKWVDLTSHLRSMAGNSRLISTGLFFHLAGDPLHLVVKELRVEYKIDGKKGSVVLNEYFDVEARRPRNEVILPEL